MNVFLKIFLFLFVLGLVVACSKDEVTSRNYPKLSTLPVSEITPGGARFNAEITFRGEFEVINYGFAWGEASSPTKQANERVVFPGNIMKKTFSTIIETTLKESTLYYVRAFVETTDFIVYGENKSFESLGSNAPEIKKVTPQAGSIGDTVSIAGINFSYLKKSNEILFGEKKAQIIESSDSLIIVKVPKIVAQKNLITIKIAGNSNTFPTPFKSETPRIDFINPQLVSFGDTIEITGDFFSHLDDANKISIGDVEANIIMSSKKKLKVLVPNNLKKSSNKLRLHVGGAEATFEPIQIKPPIIESLNLTLITTFDGENIEIIGQNFNPQIDKNRVLIGDDKAAILYSTKNKLTVELPRSVIPLKELSVLDTLDVSVKVLDQDYVLKGALFIDYKSTWTKMKDFPGRPRIYGASFSIGEKGYIGLGGGDEYKTRYIDFWEYDPVKDSWRVLDVFPGHARSHFATFVIGNKAYIVGGTKGNMYEEKNNLREVWEFNALTNKWTQKKDFPGGSRYNLFGFSINNTGYIGGGIHGNYEAQKDFWKYNPVDDSWTQLKDIPENIWHEDIFSISDNKYGYVLSGYCGSPCLERFFWRYDPFNDEWQSIANMPGPYMETTGFNINNKLYIGTGVFSLWRGMSGFFAYDPSTDRWTSNSFIKSIRTASSYAIGNYGYLLLGRTGSHSANKNDVWKFDPSKPN